AVCGLLTGGFGSVIGTALAAAMLGMVQLGIIDAQWDSNWTYTFQGAILFLAVILNMVVRRRAPSVRRCHRASRISSRARGSRSTTETSWRCETSRSTWTPG